MPANLKPPKDKKGKVIHFHPMPVLDTPVNLGWRTYKMDNVIHYVITNNKQTIYKTRCGKISTPDRFMILGDLPLCPLCGKITRYLDEQSNPPKPNP